MSKAAKHKQKLRSKKKQQKTLRKKRKATKQNNAFEKFFSILTGGDPISKREIMTSQQYLLYECQISDNWKDTGLAYIWLTRKTPLALIVAIYLVDVKCLGLKDTYISAFRETEDYEDYKAITMEAFSEGFQLQDCSYSLANAIVYGGIAYAKQFGFHPHKGFTLSKYILADKIAQMENIQFGAEDGKPYYIAGPNDNITRIMQQLIGAVGENGFHYLIEEPENEE